MVKHGVASIRCFRAHLVKLKSQLMKSTMIRAVLVEKCIQKGKIHAVKEVSLIIPDMKVSRIFAQLRCNKIMLLFLKFFYHLGVVCKRK
eukprot:XP_001707893.1 Hypothetical protein GL50803_102142 [Giardia lamblia ATCC 50803]